MGSVRRLANSSGPACESTWLTITARPGSPGRGPALNQPARPGGGISSCPRTARIGSTGPCTRAAGIDIPDGRSGRAGSRPRLEVHLGRPRGRPRHRSGRAAPGVGQDEIGRQGAREERRHGDREKERHRPRAALRRHDDGGRPCRTAGPGTPRSERHPRRASSPARAGVRRRHAPGRPRWPGRPEAAARPGAAARRRAARGGAGRGHHAPHARSRDEPRGRSPAGAEQAPGAAGRAGHEAGEEHEQPRAAVAAVTDEAGGRGDGGACGLIGDQEDLRRHRRGCRGRWRWRRCPPPAAHRSPRPARRPLPPSG